jgi:hypothetical protein
MAIYHCHCKIISRGQGRSAVGAAAYRSGEKITNEYDGMEHDYTKKGGVSYSEIILCESAPKEYQDRATLWNEVERIEKGSRAQLSREYEVALPIELTKENQIQLVRNFAKETFVDMGMCVDFSIHDKKDGNPHAHIMLTTRPIEKDGTWGAKATNDYVLDKNGNRILQKTDKQNRKIYKRIKTDTTDWNTKEFLQRSRESWAEKVNRELEKKNLPQRVDHRSFKEQGIDREPTIHEGGARGLEKRGIETDRGNINREIREANSQLKALSIIERGIQKDIDYIRDDIKWNGQHEAIAKIETQIPKAAGNEKVLLSVQAGLLKLYERAKLIEPTKTSEGRTVEYDGKQTPYFDYHKNKMVADISFLQDKVKNNLEALKEKEKFVKLEQAQPIAAEQQTEKQGGFAARREALTKQEQPQEKPQIDVVYAEKMAQSLATLRNEFVREWQRGEERTSYQPNPIYSKQANEIESLSRTVSDQSRSIETFKAERDKLGLFKGKEKKEIQGKIDSFERLHRGNTEKLKALGVSDPSKADEVIKEKRTLAAAEQEKAQAAKLNEGARGRAEEAKAVFLEVAKSIPADQRQAVLDRIEQYKERPEAGRLQQFKAEAEARRQLDHALKVDPQERQKNKIRERGREQGE